MFQQDEAFMQHTTSYRLALIGFGAAGRGLTQILRDGADWLLTRLGVDMRFVGV